jgi:hypothetical protein
MAWTLVILGLLLGEGASLHRSIGGGIVSAAAILGGVWLYCAKEGIALPFGQ